MKDKIARIVLSLLLAFTLAVPAVAVSQPASVEAAAKLNKTQVLLGVGGTFTLKVSGTTATSFKSSKATVATVSKTGKITAKKKGTTTISVECKNGKTYKCTVTVVSKAAANKTYLVSSNIDDGNEWSNVFNYLYDYDKSGNVIREENRISNQYSESEEITEYYSNGNIKLYSISQRNYKTVRYYDEDGTEIGKEQYTNGELTSAYRTYAGNDIEKNNVPAVVTKDKNGKVTQKTYSFMGNQYEIGLVNVTEYYDKYGKRTKRTGSNDAGTYSIEETYFADGTLKTSKTDNQVSYYSYVPIYSEYEYNEFGDCIYAYEKKRNGGESTVTNVYERDSKNRIVSKTSNRAYDSTLVTTYKYDANDRVIEEITSDESGEAIWAVTYSYNEAGQPTKYTEKSSYSYHEKTCKYDKAGRITEQSESEEMFGSKTTTTDKYTYDANGNQIEHSQTYEYGSTKETYVTKTTYFKNGNPKTETEITDGVTKAMYFFMPDGQKYTMELSYVDGKPYSGISYDYDDEGNLKSWTSYEGSSVTETATYDGNVVKRVKYAYGKITEETIKTTKKGSDGSYSVVTTLSAPDINGGKQFPNSFTAYDKQGKKITDWYWDVFSNAYPEYIWSNDGLTLTIMQPSTYHSENEVYVWTFDANGHLLSENDKMFWTYDDAGNMTSYRAVNGYDWPDSITQWTYDKYGNVLTESKVVDGEAIPYITNVYKSLKSICTK